MRSVAIITLSVLMATPLVACGKTHPKPSVWEMYDVRHPVPADSVVPISRATQYDQYIDNDEYYIPPDAYPTDPD